MKLYYAHPMAIYNTPQETRDVRTLQNLGFEVINPNEQKHRDEVERIKKSLAADKKDAVMFYFSTVVLKCNCLAFRALPGGFVHAGVAYDIEVANRNGLEIIELPSFSCRKILTVEETVAYLQEVGQR